MEGSNNIFSFSDFIVTIQRKFKRNIEEIVQIVSNDYFYCLANYHSIMRFHTYFRMRLFTLDS